jgi:flagellar basal body rod protein FlgC
MSSITSIATSGMNAAMLRLGASAHNVANMMTPEFHSQQVVQATQPGGGVTASLTQAGDTGTDLAGEVVQQMTAVYAFKSNLRMIQIEQDMLGSLLDVRA